MTSGAGNTRDETVQDEHFPWHYTEFGVVCACGLPMDRDERCAVLRAERRDA